MKGNDIATILSEHNSPLSEWNFRNQSTKGTLSLYFWILQVILKLHWRAPSIPFQFGFGTCVQCREEFQYQRLQRDICKILCTTPWASINTKQNQMSINWSLFKDSGTVQMIYLLVLLEPINGWHYLTQSLLGPTVREVGTVGIFWVSTSCSSGSVSVDSWSSEQCSKKI